LYGRQKARRPREFDVSDTRDRPNRVRELRENRLMTQAQLARKAKVALRTIHSVEKGMNCRMDTKRKILLALGMRFEDKDHVVPPARPVPEVSESRDPFLPH
jgi:DNA-binding XRE family transcriptional regulator